MTFAPRPRVVAAVVAALAAASFSGAPRPAVAQDMPGGHGDKPGMTMPHGGSMPGASGQGQGMHDRMQQMHGGHAGAQAGMAADGALPRAPGQDAFGAIQEIVVLLEGDPKTDWSKVDLEALRRHLIDMNEVTLNAVADAGPVTNGSGAGGLAVAVTGSGRTAGAIQRMLTAHAKEIDGRNGWSVKAEPIANGVRLTVTSADPKEIAHIRGLGFIGIMASGAHHQAHHLAMAKGELGHAH